MNDSTKTAPLSHRALSQRTMPGWLSSAGKALGLLLVVGCSFLFFNHLMGPVAQVGNGPIDVSASLRGETVWIAELGSGWGLTDIIGTPIKDNSATIRVPLQTSRKSNVIITIQADNRSGRKDIVEVVTPDGEVHPWSLAQVDKRLIFLEAGQLPSNAQLPLTFKTSAPSGSVRIRSISVAEAPSTLSFAGSIEKCGPDRVTGWAAFEKDRSPVALIRDGKPSPLAPIRRGRADLSGAGIIGSPGFEFVLRPPARQGEEIVVRFPNGTQLQRSPCKVS